jgi:hypothetical protein
MSLIGSPGRGKIIKIEQKIADRKKGERERVS